MEVVAKSKYLRISPRKLRIVADLIKGTAPITALEKLKFINKSAAKFLINVLRQAIGNAKNNFQLKPEDLKIKEILVAEGPRIKRLDKSHSARFDRGIRQKRMSHIKVILSAKVPE